VLTAIVISFGMTAVVGDDGAGAFIWAAMTTDDRPSSGRRIDMTPCPHGGSRPKEAGDAS
jgi:hypothetical protein